MSGGKGDGSGVLAHLFDVTSRSSATVMAELKGRAAEERRRARKRVGASTRSDGSERSKRLNIRCSVIFLAELEAAMKAMNASQADVLHDALSEYVRRHNYVKEGK